MTSGAQRGNMQLKGEGQQVITALGATTASMVGEGRAPTTPTSSSWAGPAQLLSVFRNSPFSVICREEVLLGDKPLRCDVTA